MAPGRREQGGVLGEEVNLLESFEDFLPLALTSPRTNFTPN